MTRVVYLALDRLSDIPARAAAALVASGQPAPSGQYEAIVPQAVAEELHLPGDCVITPFANDMFEVVPTLAERLWEARNEDIIISRTECDPAALALVEEGNVAYTAAPHCFAARGADSRHEGVLLHELLAAPVVPTALYLPAGTLDTVGTLDARFGMLAFWELLLRVAATERRIFRKEESSPAAPEPWSVIDQYYDLLERQGLVRTELPPAYDEWQRLVHTWHTAVISAHLAIFRAQIESILPSASLGLAWTERYRLAVEKRKTAEASFQETKRKYKDCMTAYASCKAGRINAEQELEKVRARLLALEDRLP
ncbi:MAG: hypothetical protein KDD69_02995 [Bdellovibrionales bacterium]|nr:hypothetical protein [Bdellovibrionales bacterium]